MTLYDVAIIGSGFSGTMVAINLARQSRLRVALIERESAHGLGVAYGTQDSQHLLNVNADRMGAFAGQPGHFHEWLQAGGNDAPATGYVPRPTYGAYLRELLADTIQQYGSIDTLHGDITDIAPGAQGYELSGKGLAITARQVVLALGNFPPGAGIANPYDPALLARLAGSGDVFLVGTGLTTLDLLATIARTKSQGKVHVLSRTGLMPQVHEPTVSYPQFLDAVDLPKTALALLTRVRREVRLAEAKGIGWQSVVDALRSLNNSIWQALSLVEQRKFLHRLRTFWETHRHRCAPEVMAAHDRLMVEGRLISHRGTYISMAETPLGAAVTWLPHGTIQRQTTMVECAALCTGPQSDCRKLDDPLVKALLGRDLLAPDILRLGFDTDAAGRLKDAKGIVVPGLYTIGRWRRSGLYESIAVREIREQAAELATRLVEHAP